MPYNKRSIVPDEDASSKNRELELAECMANESSTFAIRILGYVFELSVWDHLL